MANKNKAVAQAALLSSLFLGLSAQVLAVDYYVSAKNGIDTNDCLSWGTACLTIGEAVNKAASGDGVLIEEGVYTPSAISIASKTLTITGSYIEGTFNQNINRHPTIITGDVNGDDFAAGENAGNFDSITNNHADISGGENTERFLLLGDGAVVKLQDLIITGFDRTTNSSSPVVHFETSLTEGTLQLENVSVIGNKTISLGAITAGDGDTTNGESDVNLIVNNSKFVGNAGKNGSAISLREGVKTEINFTEFSSNDATNNGGALYALNSGDVSIDGALFDSNTTVNDGGGVYINGRDDPQATVISNATFFNNTAADGGGYASGGTLGTTEIYYSTFVNNHATAQGGGIYKLSGLPLKLSASLLSNNTAVTSGTNIRAAGSPVATIDDAGFNLYGQNGVSGIQNGSNGDLSGVIADASSIVPEVGVVTADILELSLEDNGGSLKSLKLVKNGLAMNAVDYDGVDFFGQGQSAGNRMTSVKQATGAILSYESYNSGKQLYFNIEGEIFNTSVRDDGYILSPSPSSNAESEEGVITDVDGADTWVKNIGLCNGSVTLTDSRGLPRSDFVNPNDPAQQDRGFQNCDIGAFEFNDGYQFDCFDEDGDRPGITTEDTSSGQSSEGVVCLGGDLSQLTPSALIDNIGSANFFVLLLSFIPLVRVRKYRG